MNLFEIDILYELFIKEFEYKLIISFDKEIFVLFVIE